jgi:hypothetical protein
MVSRSVLALGEFALADVETDEGGRSQLQFRYQDVERQAVVRGHIFEERIEQTDFQRAVVGDVDMMFAAVAVAGDFHAASTSART